MSRNATVRFEPSGREVEVPHGTSLLEAAREAGLPVASACGEQFTCARCGMKVLAGDVSLSPESKRETQIKARNRVDAGLRLSCVLQVQSDLTVSATYW